MNVEKQESLFLILTSFLHLRQRSETSDSSWRWEVQHGVVRVPKITMDCYYLFIFKLHLRICLERKGGREREREREKATWIWKRNHGWPVILAPTGDWTHNLGMYLDQEWNLQPFGIWDDAPTNWATWPGLCSYYWWPYRAYTRQSGSPSRK